MIEFRPKLWTSLSAAAMLAACGSGPDAPTSTTAPPQASAHAVHDQAGEAAIGETGGEAAGEQGEGGAAAAGLGPVEQQALAVAQMRGHLKVAQALAATGQSVSSSPHFGHPLYEVYAQHRELFGAAALDAAPFEALNQKAAAGAAKGELEPLYAKAEAAIAALAPRGPVDQAAVLKALLEIAGHEYGVGVEGGKVVNPVEYQDAYGFTLVAAELAQELPGDAAARMEIAKEAAALAALFPGPLPPANPAAPGALLAQISRIELAAAGL